MTITWNEYQQQALTTAIYPLDRSLDYTAFGLLSELGELVGAREIERRNPTEGKPLVIGELGDNFWYTAALSDAIEKPLNEVYHFTTTKRPQTAEQSMDALIFLGGLIAGHLKKAIRDDAGHLTPERRKLIVGCLSRYMHHLEFISSDYSSVPGVLNDNLNKLNSRKQRGVLGGAGDNR